MKAYKKITIVSLSLLLCLHFNIKAQDSLSMARVREPVFKADPQRATMLALTFPGFGQIYNRKYWKIPFVYAGFGGVGYAVSYNSKWHNKYMKAYQDFIDDIPETNSFEEILWFADPESWDDPVEDKEAIAYYSEAMLRRIDYHKKYRDLSYIGIALWYLVTVLDANVDASLYNYDISDNLDIAVFPTQMPLWGAGVGLNVSMIITF